MAANSYNFGVNLKINADTQLAKLLLGSLQQQLSTISNMKVNFSGINALTSEINKASTAALTLQQNLTAALNPDTGNLNFSKFNAAILNSGLTVDGLAQSLLGIGPEGNKAFVQLANSVARAEVPLLRTSAAVNGLWDNLKKTAGWQLSSSMIHGFIGGVQLAVGYAKALDLSLTNIRIVTGQSAELMALFAKEANTAARRLSTTTTDYTNASLIYYQLGLSASEVKKRADVTLKMANVSGQSAEKVADQMTAIWNNFDDGTKSMEHYADVMTALGAATASSSLEIAKGILKFSAISETVGLSYEYAASALATITATTRESADTVGNSLKTLFSRILGLLLGDTLDDGTTLNKYSTALAKVGISIKDASGALKDMDSILDDMGAKWHTLAEDQKMALAQTVGGVRQYTQIMTLMENWDFFKSNLSIAEGSAGTLLKQMDIFENSWLGAQKRMKASWENLWDTLLDSEGFKRILNVGSTIVDGFAKAFLGLGGMGGIFSGGALGFLTSSLGTLFAPLISNATNTLLHNVGLLLPGARGRAERERSTTIESMVNTIMDEYQTPFMTLGLRKVAAQNLQNLSLERSAYYAQLQYLTPDQKNAYSILDSLLATVRARQEETARLIDENAAANRRYSIGKKGSEGVYLNSVYTDKNGNPVVDQNGNPAFNRMAGGMSTLWQTLFSADGDDTIAKVATSFGQRSAHAIEEINTMTADLARGFKLPTKEEAERGVKAGATFQIGDLLTKGDVSKGEKAVSGSAWDTLTKLWKVSETDRKLFEQKGLDAVAANKKNQYSAELVALARKLKENVDEVQTTIDKTKNYDQQSRSEAVSRTMHGIVLTAGDNLATGLSSKAKDLGATKEDVAGMVTSAQKMTAAEYLQKRDAENEAKIKNQLELLLKQTQTAGSILTNSALGISSTATAITSMRGAIDNWKSGNKLGALTGMGSTAMNLMWGNLSLSKGIFGLTSKLAGSEEAAQKRNELLAAILQKRLDALGKEYKPGITGQLQRGSLAAQEYGLKTVNKLSSTMNTLAANAGKAAAAILLSMIAYSFISKKIDEVVNKEKHLAEQSTASALQLLAAYLMSKNNTASLQASVEKYNVATEKLYDTNLKGAAKLQAIYELNSIASDLISRYGDIINENGGYTRVGDAIKISDKALKAAEELSIADTQIARYAADRAKLQANIDLDKYDEVTLERTFGYDGSLEYNLANTVGSVALGGLAFTGLVGAGAMGATMTGAATAAAATAGATAATVGAAAGGAVAGGATAALGAMGAILSGPIGWAILATAVVAGGALIAGKVSENALNSSLIDEIMKKAESEGSLAWLDELQVGDTIGDTVIDKKDLENIQNNRKEINNLYNNRSQRKAQKEMLQENIARDLLKNHTDTKDFKDSDKLIAGLMREQDEWDDNLIDYSKKKYRDERIAAAQSIEDLLGLTGRNVVWTDDEKNKRLTYTYTDLNGNLLTSELSYQALAEEKGVQKGKAEADKYISQMMNTYEDLKAKYGETVASGMLSFMSGGDFDTATKKEMDAAQAYMLKILGGYDAVKNKWGNEIDKDLIAKVLGLDTSKGVDAALEKYAYEQGFTKIVSYDLETDAPLYVGDINKLFESLRVSSITPSSIFELMEKDFAGETGKYKDWFLGKGKAIYESMDEATMREFYKELSFLGSNASAYLNNLTELIDGVNPNRIGELMSALTSVDWSDWSGLETQVMKVLEEFGVELNTENDYLREFIRTIQETAKAIPNLTELMESLSQVSGKLELLKLGDSIDQSTMEAFAALNIDLKDYTFSTWSGDNILNKDTGELKKVSREKTSDAYWAYMDLIEAVKNAFEYPEDNEEAKDARKEWLNENLLGYTRDLFLDFASGVGEETSGKPNLSRLIAEGVLGPEAYKNMIDAYNQLNSFKKDEIGWYTEDSKGNRIDYSEETYEEKYKLLTGELDNYFNIVKFAAEASIDPTKLSEVGEVLASTYGSYDEALQSDVIQDMINQGAIERGDIATYYALINHKDALADDIEAYTYAVKNLGQTERDTALEYLEQSIAVQDALNNYKALTGKKIGMAEFESAKEEIKEELAKETVGEGELKTTRDLLYTDEELTKLTEESIVAGNAEHFLQTRGSALISEIVNMDGASTKGLKAAAQVGKYMQQFLGLTEYNIQNIGDESKANPIIDAIKHFENSISKIIAGDTAEAARLRLYLIQLSLEGKSLTNKLKIHDDNRSYDYVLDDWGRPTKQLSKKGQAYNNMAEAYEDGNLEEFKEAAAVFADLEQPWEEYNAGVSMASKGTMRAKESGTLTIKLTFGGQTGTTDLKYKYDKIMGLMMYQNLNKGKIDETTKEVDNRDWVTREEAKVSEEEAASIVDPEGKPKYVGKSGGGDDGGGGGGGPTKVSAKSAQELMTRYKTIDEKSAITEMQKANALTQKDLLYGEAKIAQLQKINSLLVKLQRLTADRIEEERQYLAEDKKHLQEVLDRYNKDKKDADGNLLEGQELLEFTYNSEGLITNYKLTIGAMAEELAAFYRDGELAEDEGGKVEDYLKKIEELKVVMQDYEDSLNQLQTSIDTYELTLYEMFANQAEELAYKVTYKLEIENDDLAYIKFYTTALKDSMGRISDYIELTGDLVNELYDLIDVYNQGVIDLMDNAANNPTYTWATNGLENVLTAEDVTNLRTYRDGLNTTYSSLTALRKEVEDKVLKVFDDWHDKINKNIDSISRYTDMLSQFKDIINIVGKEALGLSDAFMKTFEQQTINLSKDNIEAAKRQYESLVEIYAEAQMKLEQARASGNEESIEHWEDVVDKTQSEMEGAQDAMLTTLTHTLNMVAEQFTNTLTEALDTFNESIYASNGLDGMIADYEAIREQQDLMVADYEKIYNLNKLNRQLEKTLDDTKIIAGKLKLLEFQEKINDLNRNNVELSKYELEYLQAEYELRLAEIELENARTAKDTVRLSRDSEGNWSYIYTLNESAIDEALLKYEDALYKMLQLSQEYTEEMSSNMMDITQRMRDEIAELSIQDFASPEEYQEAIEEIQNKYAAMLEHRESELNKSIQNSANLYNQDWQNYNNATGYKLSAAQDWIDNFSETTLGTLMGSGSYISNYSSMITESTNKLTGELADAATTYFTNTNSAMETYGTSMLNFATTVLNTTSQITASSKQATADVSTMANDMVDAFSKVADEVQNWQVEFGDLIANLLDEIGNRIKEINEIIKKSDELGKQNYSSTDLIGLAEAIDLINQQTFHNKDLFGTWTFDEEYGVARGTYTDASGEVKEDVERNIVEFTGQLVEMIDELTGKYYEARTGSSEREMYGEELKKLFLDYWKFKNIINRIYDVTDISLPEPKLDEKKVEGLSTGGYTGEWGDSGKLAFLHEKELVLNANDTANFLEALNISRQLVEMIEMNARQSSLGLGDLRASTIKDTTQTIELEVHITAEFPDATDRSEIEAAFDNLMNMASQYAYRK